MREASVAVLLIVGTLGNLGNGEPEDRRPHILFSWPTTATCWAITTSGQTYAYEPSARSPC